MIKDGIEYTKCPACEKDLPETGNNILWNMQGLSD